MPLKYFFQGYRNALDFKGRANRREFWYFFLIDLVIGICCGISDDIISKIFKDEFFTFTTIWLLFGTIPRISLAIRRLHDGGKSGWWYFFPFPFPFWYWMWSKPSMNLAKAENTNPSKKIFPSNIDSNFYQNSYQNKSNKDEKKIDSSKSKSKPLSLEEFVKKNSSKPFKKLSGVRINSSKSQNNWKANLNPQEKNFIWRNPGSNFETEEDFKSRYSSYLKKENREQNSNKERKNILNQEISYKDLKAQRKTNDQLENYLITLRAFSDEYLINKDEYKKLKAIVLNQFENDSSRDDEKEILKKIFDDITKTKLFKARTHFENDLIDEQEYDLLRRKILGI